MNELLEEILSRVPEGERAYAHYIEMCNDPTTPLGMSKKLGVSLEDVFTYYANGTLDSRIDVETGKVRSHEGAGRPKGIYYIYNNNDLVFSGTVSECAEYFRVTEGTFRQRIQKGWKEFSKDGGYRWERSE